MCSIHRIPRSISELFIKHTTLTLSKFSGEEASQYRDFILPKIENLRKSKNRTGFMLITLVLLQAIYISGSSVEVSIISIKIEDPTWTYGLLFAASQIVSMSYMFQHYACLTYVTIADINMRYQAGGWLYNYPVLDSHLSVGYLSYIYDKEKRTDLYAIYKFFIFIFSISTGSAYILIQCITIHLFFGLSNIGNLIRILSCSFILLTGIVLFVLTVLSFALQVRRRSEGFSIFS